jgi:LemA protein
MQKRAVLALGVLVLAVLLACGAGASTYNELVSLDRQVDMQWGQVENVYQRRLDLVPNLVETVKGAAAFEKDVFVEVAEARSRAANASAGAGPRPPDDPARMREFDRAQGELSTALSRLMVVVERYPELGATPAFRDLQAQLEGTENRIAVERMRFNEAAMRFNTKRNSFPTAVVARLFGDRFAEKEYFRASPGSERAPPVRF